MRTPCSQAPRPRAYLCRSETFLLFIPHHLVTMKECILRTSALDVKDFKWIRLLSIEVRTPRSSENRNTTRNHPVARSKWKVCDTVVYCCQQHARLSRQRVWEACQRTTRKGTVDGVAVLAEVHRTNHPVSIILISQFRPPLGRQCLEVPAGLVDANETPEQAALRELREETGYTGGSAEIVMPICVNDPGLSDANMVAVRVYVDADSVENRDVVPNFQDGENIETLLVPLDGLYEELLKLQKNRDCAVDARLLSIAWGMAWRCK